MPTTLVREDDGTYRLEIRGLLRKADLDRVQRDLLDQMAGDGCPDGAPAGAPRGVRGLGIATRAGTTCRSTSSTATRCERIAIVGDERWRGEALMFAAADLRKGPVEYFTPDLEPEARAWLGLA